ncbi:hypothetical protein M1N16_04870 [Nitrospinaceae bacterium]|nr:hypothetical protein [Nitrospinaceae bacterium]
MIKDSIEHLIKIATNPPYSNNLLAARQEYQKYAGDIFDDDKSYENQMALFLEWYIFDRIDPAHDQTVLELIINNGKGATLDLLKNINGFISHIHGLFIIKKIKDHSVKAINLFNNEQYDVVEPSGKLYFSKNSIFEGRLLIYENSYYFTGNFCFHPEGSKKFIKSEIKKIFSVQKINSKELKLQNVKLKNENKKLNKTISSIEKLQEEIQTLDSEKKIFKIKKDLSELESIKKKNEENYSLLKQNINTFTHEKIIRESRSIQLRLMLKLSSMRLLLERSRNIDLKDIYKN